LLYPFLDFFGIQVDEDLQVMQHDQTPNEVCARVMAGLEPIVRREKPALILVQGDTTTALAAALTGFHHRIPVGHVEAGLRSGNPLSPFPEEMNRRLVSQVATYHFAATKGNRAALLAEGVPEAVIFVTGNPIVDSLQFILKNAQPSPRAAELLQLATGKKLIVLTTHRRESFGEVMRQHGEHEHLASGFIRGTPFRQFRECVAAVAGVREHITLWMPLRVLRRPGLPRLLLPVPVDPVLS